MSEQGERYTWQRVEHDYGVERYIYRNGLDIANAWEDVDAALIANALNASAERERDQWRAWDEDHNALAGEYFDKWQAAETQLAQAEANPPLSTVIATIRAEAAEAQVRELVAALEEIIEAQDEVILVSMVGSPNRAHTFAERIRAIEAARALLTRAALGAHNKKAAGG